MNLGPLGAKPYVLPLGCGRGRKKVASGGVKGRLLKKIPWALLGPRGNFGIFWSAGRTILFF